MFRTFICPYCFEKCKLKDVQFRCTNRRCKDYDDLEITRYENGDTTMPKKGGYTFRPSHWGFSVPSSARCPECGQQTHIHICPKCHNKLPESSLTGKDTIISIVGSRASGKSHFVGVIIKELRDRISTSFDGALEGEEGSYPRWQTRFGDKLYGEKSHTLEQTSSSMYTPDEAYRPLIFKLRLAHPFLFGRKRIDSYTFVFFDTAGEDLKNFDTMTTVNKYICKSAGIVFLLDPVQIQKVASNLDDSVVARASGGVNRRNDTGVDDIMTRVSRLIRDDQKLSDTALIKTPVAAVFSKFDVIERLVPEGSILHQPSPHCEAHCFDVQDQKNVNDDVEGLLSEWEAQAFISQLQLNYKTYSFFAVSALGHDNNPELDGSIRRPNPHRIEDPILWLLYKQGIIKGNEAPRLFKALRRVLGTRKGVIQ